MHAEAVCATEYVEKDFLNDSCGDDAIKALEESHVVDAGPRTVAIPGIPSIHDHYDVSIGLSEADAAIFAAFSRLCGDRNLLDRPQALGRDDSSDGLIDPASLLRFLRARRFDAQSAVQQLAAAQKFRHEKYILQVNEKVDLAHYDLAYRLLPHWTGRRDRRGQPIYVLDTAYLDRTIVASWRRIWDGTICTDPLSNDAPPTGPNLQQLAAVCLDYLVRFVLPLCTLMDDRPEPRTPITKAVFLVDAGALTLKFGWELRDFAQDVCNLLATSYPEIIDRVFVCNAPSYFPTIWNFLKRWIDPVTAEKVVALPIADMISLLSERIEPINLPVQFGGQFAYEHGMIPDLDDGIDRSLTWLGPRNLSPGPIKWTVDENGHRTAVAVGSIDGKPRCVEVATLAGSKRTNPDESSD